jgi:recombination protein RecR
MGLDGKGEKKSHPARNTEAPPADSFERLIREFEKLPGIGRRSAERIAYHILGVSREEAMALAIAIRDLKKNLHPCAICGDLTEKTNCRICDDPGRDAGVVCVVEWPREVRAVEKSSHFRGRYHVLMGRLSPLAGVGPGDLRLEALLQRVHAGDVRELVLATSPTVEGDATAVYIARQAKKAVPHILTTRLARGVPEGSDLSFAQSGTIGEALRGRREISLPEQ